MTHLTFYPHAAKVALIALAAASDEDVTQAEVAIDQNMDAYIEYLRKQCEDAGITLTVDADTWQTDVSESGEWPEDTCGFWEWYN